jgi:hypothetical protein
MAPMLKAALWAVPLAIVMSLAADGICALFDLAAYKPANGWTALFAGGFGMFSIDASKYANK